MKIKGKDAFAKQLAALPAAMKDEIRKAIVTSAEDTVDVAKRFAPVATGALRNSIGWTGGAVPRGAISTGSNARAAKSDEGLAATVYAGDGVAFYARFQEFGTTEMPAQPFFYPAYRLTKKRAKARIQRAVTKGAKKAFGK